MTGRKLLVGLVAAIIVGSAGFVVIADSNRPKVKENVSLFGRTPGTGFGGCPAGEACFLVGSVSRVKQGDATVLRGSVSITRWPAGPNPTDQSITIIIAGMTVDDKAAALNGFVISDMGTSPSLIDAGDADDVAIAADGRGMTIVVTLDTDGSSGGPFTLTFENGGGGNPNNVAVVVVDD